MKNGERERTVFGAEARYCTSEDADMLWRSRCWEHRFTLRALAWRDDFGSESYWAVELGKRVAARGADELWPLVASR